MVHTAAHKMKTIDAELVRTREKHWYDEDEATPDELLDKRLELMREQAVEQLEEAFRAPAFAKKVH